MTSKSTKALYRGTFAPGFQPLIRDLITRDYGAKSWIEGDDSSVVFCPGTAFQDPGYFQGIARVIARSTGTLAEAALAYAQLLKHPDTTENRALLEIKQSPQYSGRRHIHTFALRFFEAGKPSTCTAGPRRQLEDAIGRILNARPESVKPDLELQLSLRQDRSVALLATWRLPRVDQRSAGALAGSTARLLCELASPESQDVFLDPFAGSGTIPLVRADMKPFDKIFAFDIAQNFVSCFRETIKASSNEKYHKSIFPKQQDAQDLSRLTSGFITKIVTDPPWGVYQPGQTIDLVSLYQGFMAEAARVLSPTGIMVILVGRESPIDAILLESVWHEELDWPVLIAGRKARVIRLHKNN